MTAFKEEKSVIVKTIDAKTFKKMFLAGAACIEAKKEFINELNTKASGSVQLNFGPKHLKTIKLVIPPKRMLTIFENIIGPLIAEMCRLKSENSILSIIRDTLLPKLMSGEIRVPVEQP